MCIRDSSTVASLLGVSTATVSAAFSASDGVAWATACDGAMSHQRASTDEITKVGDGDACDTGSAAAAVACAVFAHQRVAGAATTSSLMHIGTTCVYAMSTMYTDKCRNSMKHERCAAMTAKALHPCSAGCVSAFEDMGDVCGGLVPRAEHGFHPGHAQERACDAALSKAYTACSTQVGYHESLNSV